MNPQAFQPAARLRTQAGGILSHPRRENHGVHAPDVAVHHAHLPAGGLGLGRGAEDGHGHVVGGAIEAAPHIVAVVAVVGHARHRQRVQRLDHQRPQTAHQHGRVAVQAPGQAAGAEESEVAHACRV